MKLLDFTSEQMREILGKVVKELSDIPIDDLTTFEHQLLKKCVGTPSYQERLK